MIIFVSLELLRVVHFVKLAQWGRKTSRTRLIKKVRGKANSTQYPWHLKLSAVQWNHVFPLFLTPHTCALVSPYSLVKQIIQNKPSTYYKHFKSWSHKVRQKTLVNKIQLKKPPLIHWSVIKALKLLSVKYCYWPPQLSCYGHSLVVPMRVFLPIKRPPKLKYWKGDNRIRVRSRNDAWWKYSNTCLSTFFMIVLMTCKPSYAR